MNRKELHLAGLIVPPPTPFKRDLEIDEKALAGHLGFLAEKGVTRLLINGTTAEFFSLLPPERRRLLVCARRCFPGTILFNTAADSLFQSLEAVKWAEDLGADAVVAMAPYYYAGAPWTGLLEYFKKIESSTDLPFLLYNFSRHTGNPITPDILEKVRHAGIKDSSGDLSLIPHTSCYLAGTSRQVVEAFMKGAKGFVSSLANIEPGLYVSLEKLLNDGDMDGAGKIQDEIIERCGKVDPSNEISSLKKRLSSLIEGYPPAVRLPLI